MVFILFIYFMNVYQDGLCSSNRTVINEGPSCETPTRCRAELSVIGEIHHHGTTWDSKLELRVQRPAPYPLGYGFTIIYLFIFLLLLREHSITID